MSLEYKSDGIYSDTRTGNLYHRPIVGGRRTARKLTATTLTMARKELAALKTRQLESRLGLALDPYATLVAVSQIAREWSARGCPGRNGAPRTGNSLSSEAARVTRLLLFWGDRSASAITAEDCRDYHAWRIRRSKKKFRLDRSVDTELTTLCNMLNWAVQNPRKTGLLRNPIVDSKPRFDNPALTRHCTAVMPMTDEAVHQVATFLMASDVSRPLGWQLLLEALTGCRTREILNCRIDAKKSRQPGYQDATALHLDRLKKGIEPWALLEHVRGHSPLADCLAAFRNWHAQRYKNSPWFIPGRDPKGPMDRLSLTRALDRVCVELKLPKITSHGLRAYFVRTLRALGVDDSEIAKRLGHRSGVGEVEKTYGITEPGWFGSRRMDFIPEGFPPAWAPWLQKRSKKIVDLSAYHPHTATGKNGSTSINQTSKSKADKRAVNIVESKIARKTPRK